MVTSLILLETVQVSLLDKAIKMQHIFMYILPTLNAVYHTGSIALNETSPTNSYVDLL